MKRYPHTAILLLTGALAAGPITARAADAGDATLTAQSQQMDGLATTRGEGAVAGRISSDFMDFAGSQKNADALVTGLRSGSAITLTSPGTGGTTTSTTFTPPTGKMGYGNVYTSLALAKQNLVMAGITDPSASQIQAALMGGTVTAPNGQATTLTGVLQLRAQGMGWGQIAQQYGYKLGPVISGMKSSNASLAASSSTTTTTAVGKGVSSGVVTAGGSGSNAGGQGQGNAYGRGIVTGAGTGVGPQGQGNAYGRGIVTGGGTAGAQAGAHAAGQGQGKALGKGN